MKIGIFTFWWSADNYGQLLQCYALQQALKQIFPGAAVSVADYRSRVIEDAYRIVALRKTWIANLTQFVYAPSALKKRARSAGAEDTSEVFSPAVRERFDALRGTGLQFLAALNSERGGVSRNRPRFEFVRRASSWRRAG